MSPALMSNASRTFQCFQNLALLGVLACSDSKSDDKPDAEADAERPAVMVATQVVNPEGSDLYVGAYPSLPRETDLSEMLEVSGGNDARAYDGHVFVWSGEEGTYTRYDVNGAYALTNPKRVNFLDLGGAGTIMTRFISPTRAYSLTRMN